MAVERAIWYPYWYELDQAIAVGKVDDFIFFGEPPETVKSDGLPVFYHGLWREESRHLHPSRRKLILRIWHPVLGEIQRIETDGLDYTFGLADGRVLQVNAEETPGQVYEHTDPIRDWHIFVEMEPA